MVSEASREGGTLPILRRGGGLQPLRKGLQIIPNP